MCSDCFPGYELSWEGDCVPNNCTDPNCKLCDSDNSICFTCSEGYMPDMLFGKNCVEIPLEYSCMVEGCSVCDSSNNMMCLTCNELYKLNGNNTCDKFDCGSNCLFCLEENSCLMCAAGFYLSGANYTCTPINESTKVCDIENCLLCSESWNMMTNMTEQYCEFCTLGFQPS